MDEVAIVIADTSGSIRYWSRGAEKTFGHTEKDAVGQSLDLIVPEEFRKSHWMGFRATMASGSASIEGQQSAFPVAATGGRIVNAPGKLTLLRGLDDKVVGAMVIFGLIGPAGLEPAT